MGVVRMNGDYGYFGKGVEGYVQYMESFEDRGKRGGGRGPRRRGGPGCLTVCAVVIFFFYIIYVVTE
jgi:hypothetical protein